MRFSGSNLKKKKKVIEGGETPVLPTIELIVFLMALFTM
jgi:hypothetical protein